MRSPQAGLLPALRRYLALSQAQLAGLLGTTRAHVAVAETSPRPLPGPAQLALEGLLAALPPGLPAALLAAPADAPPPPAPAPPPLPPPHPPALLLRRHQAWLELGRLAPALAAGQAQAAAGAARLALLAAPAAPALTPYARALQVEAEGWTDAFAAADLRLLEARCAGLRHELALLGGPPPGA